MNYIGLWKFHSIANNNMTDEGFEITWLEKETYIAAPMPAYIDESDEESVAYEMQERYRNASTKLKISEDGNIYILLPIPEGVSPEEIEQAVEAGEVNLFDGMMLCDSMPYEIRGGEIWYNTGDEVEIDGEETEPWIKAPYENGILSITALRFIKED